jgi:hypothetical protein
MREKKRKNEKNEWLCIIIHITTLQLAHQCVIVAKVDGPIASCH